MTDQPTTDPAASAKPPKKKLVRGGRQLRYLAQSVILEEAGNPGMIRLAIYAVVTAVVAFVVWSANVVVDEVAVAMGQVIPAGHVQSIQHLEGGIVKDILVEDGILVEKGQVLVRLDPAATEAEHEQVLTRQVSLQLQAERLRAFALGRLPDFGQANERYSSLVADQWAIFQIQLETKTSLEAVLNNQIKQRQEEIQLVDAQVRTFMQQIVLLKEELEMRRTLFEKGLSSKILYFNVQRDVNEVQGEIAELAGERRRAIGALNEVESRLIDATTNLRHDALSEMGAVNAELAQVTESLRELEDRSQRVEVIAPVRGIVKGLKTHTIGGVVAAGAVLLELVPMDKELLIEARINTRDIGHVRVGLPATIKVTAFEFSRYGTIEGQVRSISATTFKDENGDPYYKGIISMTRDYAGRDAGKNRIQPGMTVQADIGTGKKTLLQYFLKPIYTGVQASFRER